MQKQEKSQTGIDLEKKITDINYQKKHITNKKKLDTNYQKNSENTRRVLQE